MKKVGLFVGINDYSNGISPLKYAMGDASDLNAEFSSKGFRTRLLCDRNATQNDIVSKTKELIRDLEAGDIFVFYFSGHGYFSKGNIQLLGSSAEAGLLDSGYGMLPLPVIEKLTAKPGVKRFFMLDCCQSPLHAGGKAIALCEAPVDLGSQGGTSSPLVLTSCSVGEKSFEDPASGHSVFANAVLKTLNEASFSTFGSFASLLKKHLASPLQHPCWYGDLCAWEKVPVFDAAAPEPEKKAAVPPPPVAPTVTPPPVAPVFNADSLESVMKNRESQGIVANHAALVALLSQTRESSDQFCEIQRRIAVDAQAALAAGNPAAAEKIIVDNRKSCTAIAKKFAAKKEYISAALPAAFADQEDPEIVRSLLFAAIDIIRDNHELRKGIFFYLMLFGDRRINFFIEQELLKLPFFERIRFRMQLKKLRSAPIKTFGHGVRLIFFIGFAVMTLPVFLFCEVINLFSPTVTPDKFNPKLFGELFFKYL